MKKRKIMSMLAGILAVGMVLSSQVAFADDNYPVHTTNTDANGITMTNTIKWRDDSHANNNYTADLDITINGLTDTKVYNEPIDVQVIHDISSSMDYKCYAENHYTFGYKKLVSSAFETTELYEDIKPYINEQLNELLSSKQVTGKDDWIKVPEGTKDRYGKNFSDDAYFVPKVSFYKLLEEISPLDYEYYFYVVDEPKPSAEAEQDEYSFWVNYFHASKDENGKFHTLSTAEDPTQPKRVSFDNFNRYTSIDLGCKTYTTTAYKLLSKLGSDLYNASPDTHMSITSFSTDVQYTSPFADNENLFSGYIKEAFNKTSGSTNYEAGFVQGRENLDAHTDNDARKKVIIFISDGRPNYSLDEQGNIADSFNDDDFTRLMSLTDDIKASGTEIYTVGYCISPTTNNNYLKPLATDDSHAYFREPGRLDDMVEIYGLIKEKVITETYIKATINNTISEYYEVDKNNLPAGVSVIEEEKESSNGTKRLVQTIKYNVRTEDLGEDGINKVTVPVILKEQYRNTTNYYPINDDLLDGSTALYEKKDGTKQNISVKTTWLDVETKKDDTPIDPEAPVDPDKPVDPETPVNPEKPDTTITPEVTDNTKPNTTTETTTTNKNSSVKTSDDIQTNKYLVISIISLSGLLAILCKTRYDFKNI